MHGTNIDRQGTSKNTSAVSNSSGSASIAANQPAHVSWAVLTETELLGRVKAGSRTALSELMRRHQQRIARYAYGLTGNRDTADDLIAAANIRICQGIATCRSSIILPAWLHCTVRNAWYDMLRFAQRHPVVYMDALDEGAADCLRISDWAQPVISPELCAEENERNHLLYHAISTLPETQRVTVTQYYTEGLTYSQVAHQMCVPIGTVKSRLNRARLALRERLESQKSILVN